MKKADKAYKKAQEDSDPRNDPRFKVSKKVEADHKRKSEEELKKPLNRSAAWFAAIIGLAVMYGLKFDLF